MWKILAVAAVVIVIALIVGQTQRGGGDSTNTADTRQLEQGWQDVDAAIKDTVGEDTHKAISDGVSDSADAIGGFGNTVVDKVKDATDP